MKDSYPLLRLLMPYLLVIFSLCGFEVEAYERDIFSLPTIHCLITVDTKSNIKETCKQDARTMHSIVGTLSELGYPVKNHYLHGKALEAQNITLWLDQSNVSPNDTLIFYYSGHGLENFVSSSPWPLLSLQNGKELFDSGSLIRALQTKNSRLLVVITDCCNSSPFRVKSLLHFPALAQQKLSEKTSLRPVMENLFIRSRGIVSLTASKRGYVAIGTTAYGGILTNAFLLSLLLENENGNADWRSVLESTHTLCVQAKQIPYYEYSVMKDPAPPYTASASN